MQTSGNTLTRLDTHLIYEVARGHNLFSIPAENKRTKQNNDNRDYDSVTDDHTGDNSDNKIG